MQTLPVLQDGAAMAQGKDGTCTGSLYPLEIFPYEDLIANLINPKH